MTHEERARAWLKNELCTDPQPHDMVQCLAAAFAEVEREAIARCTRNGFVERKGVGQYQVDLSGGLDLSSIKDLKIECAYTDPGTSGLPVPKPECWGFHPGGRCDAKGCKAKPIQQIAPGGIMAKLMADADGGREAMVPLPACTCGAASCGSRLHSDYCDSFGVV